MNSRSSICFAIAALPIWAAAAFSPASASASDLYPTLNIQGEIYENACTPKNKAELQTQMNTAIADKKSQAAAWKVVDTVLCQKSSKAVLHYLDSIVPKEVPFSGEGTGQESTTFMWSKNDSIGELLAEGKAWDASIKVDEDSLNISYAPDEACSNGREFKLVKGKWSLVSLSQGCD